MNQPATTYMEFIAHRSISERCRTIIRDHTVSLLSVGRKISSSSRWVRFPYYHHVFDDEKKGFTQQLGYLKNFGEFISLSDAVILLGSGAPIDGQYFCITFDDGFKNNFLNALPILVENKVPATFFVVTDFIGRSLTNDYTYLRHFFDHGQVLMEFMSWEDCKNMIDSGMEIGSHTVSHARLANLDADQVKQELSVSKALIEERLSIKCQHFCVPFGQPDRDFDTNRDPNLVKNAGYVSMLTTERGVMEEGGDPYKIRRDHILANWSLSQIRYFFS